MKKRITKILLATAAVAAVGTVLYFLLSKDTTLVPYDPYNDDVYNEDLD